jgi:glycosyltransferase involved in cell wall biosynthesis
MLLLNDMLRPFDGRVYREARTLFENGYDVHVVCWTRRTELTDETENYEGITIHRVAHDPGPVDSSLLHKRRTFREVRKLMASKAMSLGPGIVHAHDLEALPIAAEVKRSLRIPIVFDAHEDWPAMEAKQSMVMGILTRVLQRWYIGSADGVITVSDGVAKRLKGAKGGITIIHNARLVSEISSGERIDALRRELGIGASEFVVGYVGKIWDNWGYEVALKAMKELNKDGVRLLVVGGPEKQKEKYKGMARDMGISGSCIFTGQVPYKEIGDYLSVIDMGVMLFERDELFDIGLPNRLFDYMGAGVPFVTTSLPMIVGVVKKYDCALIIPPSDVQSLVEAIRKLKGDQKLRKELGERARRAFRDDLSWERQEEKLIALYKRLLHSS